MHQKFILKANAIQEILTRVGNRVGLFEGDGVGLKVGASVLRIGALVGGFVTVVVSQVPHVCLQATEANVPSELSNPHRFIGASPIHTHV